MLNDKYYWTSLKTFTPLCFFILSSTDTSTFSLFCKSQAQKQQQLEVLVLVKKKKVRCWAEHLVELNMLYNSVWHKDFTFGMVCNIFRKSKPSGQQETLLLLFFLQTQSFIFIRCFFSHLTGSPVLRYHQSELSYKFLLNSISVSA